MKCTHIALQVRNMDDSIRFYQRFCGLKVVHVDAGAFHEEYAKFDSGLDGSLLAAE